MIRNDKCGQAMPWHDVVGCTLTHRLCTGSFRDALNDEHSAERCVRSCRLWQLLSAFVCSYQLLPALVCSCLLLSAFVTYAFASLSAFVTAAHGPLFCCRQHSAVIREQHAVQPQRAWVLPEPLEGVVAAELDPSAHEQGRLAGAMALTLGSNSMLCPHPQHAMSPHPSP